MRLRILIQTMVLALLSLKGLSQPFPLSVDVTVNPPYTANYTAYFTEAGKIFLRINNTSGITKNVYLAGSISTIDGSVEVRTDPSAAWAGPALVVNPGVNTYTGSELRPMIENTNVDFTGITAQDIASGLLPEGTYQICIRAYEYTSLQPLSANEPQGCSNQFSVGYPPPPQIIAPSCGSSVSRTSPQNLIFSWQSPTGVPSGVSLRYRFTLVHLPDGIDAVSALTNPVDPIYQTETPSNSINYNAVLPALISPRTYAWWVQAFDQNNTTLFQNQGYSEPCVFNLLNPGSSGNPFTLVFPLSGDTLPWDVMPIIHRFDPYSVHYVGYDKDFTIRRNGSIADNYVKHNSWPKGPELSQEEALTLSITQEQAQHVNLYKPMSASPPAIPFLDGNRYDWDADIDIENESGPDLNGSLSGFFVNGMGRPRPIFPPNAGAVTVNQQVGLRFLTSAPPQRIVPPFAVTQTGNTPGANFFDGGIDERWVLEVSRKETFDSILKSGNRRMGSGLGYLISSCNDQCLLDSLYKEETFNFTPEDTGKYYWRVRWLTDPSSPAGASYLNGPVWSFNVRDTSYTPPEDSIPATAGECVNTCAAPMIPVSERNPVTRAGVDSVVTVGLFRMTIKEITWSGGAATGKGTIPVRFMHAPLKVTFTGIRINSANKVYDGTIKGEYDNASVIPTAFTDGVTNLASLNETQARNLNTFVNTAGRLVSQFAGNTPVGLPIGLDQEIEDQRVTVGIVGVEFTPEIARLNAMVALDFAPAHGWLSLGATNICFHPDGIGGDGKGMLYLPLDHDIPFSDSVKLRFKKTTFDGSLTTVLDSGTYVSWDCRGFKSLNIDGEVLFGRNILKQDLSDGRTGSEAIKAQFAVKVRRAGQWMARLNFNHPFQADGVPGWGFDVQEAWLDFSDGQNPDGFTFPRGYEFDTTLFVGGTEPDTVSHPELYWKGFYLKRLEIRLPGEFESRGASGGRITAGINNMLIDRRGLSAGFLVRNLVDVNDGKMDGWGFSIDTLLIDIAMNSFVRGGFSGEIKTSFSDSTLIYSSMLSQNLSTHKFSYAFRITPKDTLNAEIWAARLALAPTSYISVTVDTAGFLARAELTGYMSIAADLPAVGRVNFKAMEFEHLGFQTRAPYIDCPGGNCVRFGFASPQKYIGGYQAVETGGSTSGSNAGGFPISIQNIGLTQRMGASGPKAGLQFTLALNLTGETNTFSAATTLAILGKLNLGGESQAWEFDGVDLDSIGVSGSVGVVSLSGGLKFYHGDATYGNGIKGMIRATFKPVITVQVAAQFGEKSGNRYWFVDAQAVFGSGITLMPGIDLYGFGGGAWYHMRRTTSLPSAASLTNADTTGKGRPGLTLSGVSFVPDVTRSFGFSATVIFGNTGGGDAYNADVTFGAEFTNTGGISLMFLRGNGYFMCDKTDRSDPQIHAMADISYDFVRQIFDARFQVTINIAGGVVRGVNPGNIAGQVHIYASPETWFIHVGNPETPVGLNFLSLFQTQSYLMVGLNLPPPAAPPAEVTSIITPGVTFRHPGLATGDGFAFGSRMGFNTGRIGFLMFYARMAMGMGFDISLMNYGPSVFCAGAPPGSTIGVDGWYANGQMYAYITGEIGMYVDVWVAEGEFKILSLGAAALLQAGLPNPTWMQGTVGGYYNILNGLVSGNCQFEFKVGQECIPAAENPLSGIDILSELVPSNGERNVDCGVNPEASFNAEVERNFDLEEIRSDGSRVVRRFRFVIERFELKKGEALVSTERQISEDRIKAMLLPSSFLDPYTDYQIYIKIRGEEYNFGSSTWGQALKRDGTPIRAEKTNTFRTGAYPDRIPENNVMVTYPFNTQRYFLQGECNEGFILLEQWMEPLLTATPSAVSRRTFKIRLIPVDGGPEAEVPITPAENFNAALKRISFQMPTILNNKVYACQLISKDSLLINPTLYGGIIPSGLLGSSSSLASIKPIVISTLSQSFSTKIGGAIIRSNRINGRTVRKNEKLLYVFFFKTSQYNTLNDKVAGLNGTTTTRSSFIGFETLQPSFSGPEKFDVFDVNGYAFKQGLTNRKILPLVYMTDLRKDNWTRTWSQPVIYDFYSNLRSRGYTSMRLIRAYPDTVGVPPFKTISFHEGNPTREGLAPNEFLPLSTNASSVFANLNLLSSLPAISGGFSGALGSGLSGFATTPATVKLQMETALWTLGDYVRMNTIATQVQGYYGSPFTSEFYDEPVKSQFIRYLRSYWTPLMRGTYQVNFLFRGIVQKTPQQFILDCSELDGFDRFDPKISLPGSKTYTY